MSDNVTYGGKPSGVPLDTGIATDNVGGVHYQRVKIDVGGDGSASPVTDIGTSANQAAILAELEGKPDVNEQGFYLELSQGNITGHSGIHKFGNAPDFDTADSEVEVWDGAADGTAYELMNYVYSTTAAIDSISSTDDSDTQDIEVQGLDSNFDLVTQTVALTGNTRKALTTDLIRIFRAKNVGSTNLAGHVIIYENDTTADDAGIPDDSNLIRAVIHPENNQTEMAIYTIPNGYTGYLTEYYASTGGASRSSEYLIRLKARPSGQVFQLKHKFALADGSTISEKMSFQFPMRFTAKTDIVMTAEALTAAITGVNIIAGFCIILVAD